MRDKYITSANKPRSRISALLATMLRGAVTGVVPARGARA